MRALSLVHLGVLTLLPPLLLGVIQRTKAICAGRRGPAVLQPYFDLYKLSRKEVALSATTTGVFLLAPAVALASTLDAGLMVPLGSYAAPVSFDGDFVLFAYLFGLGRFFLAVGALDTGSPFEGMGAAREVGFAWLTEPAPVPGAPPVAVVSDVVPAAAGRLRGVLADLAHRGANAAIAAWTGAGSPGRGLSIRTIATSSPAAILASHSRPPSPLPA